MNEIIMLEELINTQERLLLSQLELLRYKRLELEAEKVRAKKVFEERTPFKLPSPNVQSQ